ncbi:MAG TPA: heavy-metal-associated domain-containing protein [Candidatus Ozemobacteraceae bacterium]|nr:heavy-metal-associated domain-containing protein [Candidatus Ozemobacteraceae bacterium]
MKISWVLEKIKCEGCVENVAKALLMVDDISTVEVDLAGKSVTFDALDQSATDAAKRALTLAGYPPKQV